MISIPNQALFPEMFIAKLPKPLPKLFAKKILIILLLLMETMWAILLFPKLLISILHKAAAVIIPVPFHITKHRGRIRIPQICLNQNGRDRLVISISADRFLKIITSHGLN